MKTVTLSVLITLGSAVAGIANAQAAPSAPSQTSTAAPMIPPPVPADPGWDRDAWRHFPGPALMSAMEEGVLALERRDYSRAEKIFARVLRGKPANADANLYVGVAKMNLGKWEDAKEHLEIAARKIPQHPDPKSRLGVTYAKLGNTEGAYAQRAALVEMADACRTGCRLSPFILDGIQMIDTALAESRG
jgi:tetratricopeptide (TPR) repeat protein